MDFPSIYFMELFSSPESPPKKAEAAELQKAHGYKKVKVKS